MSKPVEASACSNLYSPNAEKIILGISIITSLVSAVFLALGIAGVFSASANFAAITAGGVILGLSNIAAVIYYCLKPIEKSELQEERPPPETEIFLNRDPQPPIKKEDEKKLNPKTEEDKKADIKQQSLREKFTPLHEAICWGSEKEVEQLLQEGKIDINAQDRNGKTALHYALEDSDPARKKAHLLIGHGAIVDIQTFTYPITPLSMLKVTSANKEVCERDWKLYVHMMQKNKHLVNVPQLFTGPYLISAVFQQNVPVVKDLIACGANVNASGDDSMTPLSTAIIVDNQEIIDLLLAHGARDN